MNPSLKTVVASWCLVGMVGCAQIAVKRVDPMDPTKFLKGVRYSLPKPYVQVTPSGDGGVDADVIFLPDPDNTYVIQAKDSFISSYTFTTGLSNGQLTSIGWTADTTGVATSAIPVAGAVAQKVLDTQATVETTHATALATAKKALADANLTVQIAIAKLNLAVANGEDTKTVLGLKQDLEEAILRRDAAQSDLDNLRGGHTSSSSNADTGQQADSSKNADVTGDRPQIFAPMLYSVNERAHNGEEIVELRAARTPQDSFATVYAPTTQPTPLLYPGGVESLSPDKDKKILLMMVPSTAIVSSDIQCTLETLDKTGKITKSEPFPVALESAVSLKADLSNRDSGDYQLAIVFGYGDPKRPTTLSPPATVKVHIEK